MKIENSADVTREKEKIKNEARYVEWNSTVMPREQTYQKFPKYTILFPKNQALSMSFFSFILSISSGSAKCIDSAIASKTSSRAPSETK